MIPDSTSLDDLTPEMKPRAMALIARCVEHGIHGSIERTLTSPAVEAQKVAQGLSSTMNSKHLPQPPSGKSDAMDFAPFRHGTLAVDWSAGPGWKPGEDPGKPRTRVDRAHVSEPWATYGELAEALGLEWGGRWHQPFDPGHVNFIRTNPTQTNQQKQEAA